MENIDDAREKLQDILNQQEYQVYYEDNRSFIEIWWDNAKAWIMEQLAKIFSSFEPSNGMANGILIGIIVIVIALIALVLFLVLRKGKKRHALQDHQPLQSKNEMNWSFQQHISEAKKQEKEANYAVACRHTFLALLLYFHEQQLLKARIWKTNWDYFEELRKGNQDRADQFNHLALLFDEVVYGDRVMNRNEYIHYRDQAMKLLEEKADDTSMEG